MRRGPTAALLASMTAAWASPAAAGWKAAQEVLLGHNPMVLSGGDLVHARELGLVLSDAATGKRRRTLSPPDCHLGEQLLLSGRTVLFTCEDQIGEEAAARPGPRTRSGQLVAVDLDSGRRLWRLAGVLPDSAALLASTVVVLRRGALVAVALQDGHELWRAPGIGSPRAGPAIAGDAAFVQDAGGQLCAFDLATGGPRWRRKIPLQVFRPPAVAAGIVLAASSGPGGPAVTVVSGLDARTGELRWQQRFRGELPFHAPVPLADGWLLATTADGDGPGALRRLDAQGKVLWRSPVATDANGHDFTPVVVGAQVLLWSGNLAELKRYAVASHYELAGFDLATGARQLTWRPRANEKMQLSPPIVAGDTFFYGDGETVWSMPWPPGPVGRSGR